MDGAVLVHADREIAAVAEVMAGIRRRKKERLGVWEPVMTDSTGPRTSLKEGLEFMGGGGWGQAYGIVLLQR